jgi:hypothetical protein
MKNTETPEGTALFDDDIERVRKTLAQITRTLEALEIELTEGDPSAMKDANKLLSEIRTWCQRAMDTEARFDERRRKQTGSEHGSALDLEEAKRTIGCRLARLRTCCRSD